MSDGDDAPMLVNPARHQAIEHVQQAISRLVRLVQVPAVGEAVARETGLTLGGPYFQALTRIVRDGPITLSQMARDLTADVSALSRHVNALERRGLVQKEQDASDRRSYFLTVTKEGERIFGVLLAQWIASLDHVVADWDDDAVTRFAASFVDFVDRLGRFVDAAVLESERTRRL